MAFQVNPWHESPTPLWQSVLAVLLVSVVIVATPAGWFYWRKLPAGPMVAGSRKAGLLGLLPLTVHVALGLMLFLLPAYFFFSYHDLVGIYWLMFSPCVALLLVLTGVAMWRRALGWILVTAGVAGMAVWILVVSTMQI